MVLTAQDVVLKLVALLKEEGQINFSNIPERLAPIDYKKYSNGKGLKAWLTSMPEFEENETGLALVLAESISNSGTIAEVRFMHAFSYMNFWQQNVKFLKQLDDTLDVKTDPLREHIAHVLMSSLLLGEMDMELGEVPRLVMKTKLQMSDGHDVYAVFHPNPANTDGTKQYWALKGFCSLSASDKSELGSWLQDYLGGPNVFDYTDLLRQIDVIDSLSQTLQVEMEDFAASVNARRCPELSEDGRMSVLTAEYEEQWKILNSMLQSLPLLSIDDEPTLAGIRAFVSKETFHSTLLKQALEAFGDLAEGVRQFFAKCHWDSDENCTPIRDYAFLLKKYENGANGDPKLTDFRKILEEYRRFLYVVSFQKSDDHYLEELKRLTDYFREMPQRLRLASEYLIDFSEEERSFLVGVDEIAQILNQCASSCTETVEQELVVMPENNSQLLKTVLEKEGRFLSFWPLYLRNIFPEDPAIQKLVVPGEKSRAELTCFAVANRLMKAGHTDDAERYLILGLQYEGIQCASELLKLYRETGREEDFVTVWEAFRDQIVYSVQDEAFWFGALCRRDPEQALELSRRDVHLQYQTVYLPSLIAVAEEQGDEALAQTLKNRLQNFCAGNTPNELEQAIINDDRSAIAAVVQSEQLQTMGYSDKQIQKIREVVETGDYPSGDGAYQIGCRLYAFQGNRNSLAEQWMWQSVSEKNRGSYENLMLLLANEQRWSEAVQLYERNEGHQNRFESCRRFYLLCCYNISSELAQNVFVENLQDALKVISLSSSLHEKIKAIAVEPGNEVYAQILKLYGAVDVPYLRSVLFKDPALRDHVYDQELLSSLGLDMAVISEVYRNGMYPHGRDAVSVAHRLYAFAGNLFSAAEIAAQIAGANPAAQNLLWEIYSASQNESAQYELLTHNKELQQEHYDQYLRFLYSRGDYASFLENMEQMEQIGDMTEEQVLCRATAELTIGKTMTDSPKLCAEAAAVCDPDTCLSLLQAAASAGASDVVMEILCGCFDKWLIECPKKLRMLVTCGGNGNTSLYEMVQQTALERNILTLVVYCQNVLEIGNAQNQAEELYHHLRAQLKSGDVDHELMCLHKLQQLYPAQAEELSVQMAAVSIQAMLLSADPEEKQATTAKLEEIIASFGSNEKMFDIVTTLLHGTDYCSDYRVCTAIRNYAKLIGRSTDALLFIHQENYQEDETINPRFRDYLTRMYFNALVEARFPAQIAQEAETLCLQTVRQNGSPQAALTVAMLEQMMGRTIYANAMLNHLAVLTDDQEDFPKSTLNVLGMETMPEALKLESPLPTFLDLFEQVLDLGSESGILDFLQFCHTFMPGDIQALQKLRNLKPDQALTEQESIQAIKLLCSDPESAVYWGICAHIPFETGDGGSANFLHLCCQKNPSRWKEYVQLCETLSSASERLPAALALWSQASEDCRMYVEEKLEKHPSYLEDLDDPENLCILVRSLCDQLNERSLNMTHAQLRAVAQIAVATGEPACLEILRQHAGRLLFGSQRNLGVVVLSRLLLTGRFYEAHTWNGHLAGSLSSGNYQTLIDELSQYGPEEMREWVLDPSSKMFLELILPDGNQPNILQVAGITAKALLNGAEKETAAVLKRVLEEFPEDYATTYQLLELCKSGFEGSIPMLHFCLVRLSSITSKDNPKWIIKLYDDRPNRSHTVSLAILNQLLIHNQQINLIGEGWDFSCLTVQGLDNMGVRVEEPSLITMAEQQVSDSLNNQSPEIRDLRIQAWMANITGNWTKYLETMFRSNTPGNEVFFPPDNIDPLGFSRSVFLLLSRTEPEEYPSLLNWLSSLTALSEEKQRQLAIIRKGYEAKRIITPANLRNPVVGMVLRFPVENGVLSERLVEMVLQPMINQEPETAELVAYMIGALGYKYAVQTLYNLAEAYFSKEQDPAAYCLYSALYHVGDDFRISHENFSRFMRQTGEISRGFSYKYEEYKMKRRICGAFSGVSEHIRKLGSKDLSPWSLINMVLCLAQKRADEIWRFETYLTADNVRIAEYARMYLDRNVADATKMETIHDTEISTLGRYILARMLSSVNVDPNRNVVPNYLRHSGNSLVVKSEAERLSEELKNYEKVRIPKISLLCKMVPCQKVGDGIRNQRDPSYWDRGRSESEPKEVLVYQAPEYVSDLTPLPADPERLKMLKEQYQRIATGTYGHFSEKAQLSGEIYCLVIGGELPAEECYRALLRYSVDRFYELLSDGTQSSRGQAFRMLLTLLETGFGGLRDGAEYDALVEMVNAVGAAGLLKSYTQIRQLAKNYDEHKSAFAAMRSLITDTVIFQDMGRIYEVLDKLAKDFAQIGNADVDKLIQALRDAEARIAYTDSSGSANIRNQVQRMIRSELTVLTRRARLEIRLLNQGVQSRTGYLTGFVYNKGTVKAENLRLQAFYGIDNSEQYGLEQLLPNEKAIFEIPYECGADENMLAGYLDLMSGNSSDQPGTQCQFSLELGVTSGSTLTFNTYSADRPRFEFNPESNTVESANFFGRSEETARMRELVAEERFTDFHSAVVYGVRRTGKTSLLEYFRHYVCGTRPDCLCIRIDVQGTDETVGSVFVSCVLSEPVVMAALENCSERDIFVEKWKNVISEGVDMDPNLIIVFFRELYQLTGKGMILIIDEVDRLFKSIEDNRSKRDLNNLLSALSGLLDNDDRRKYLQLIICGSNWLMYYLDVGDAMQQVFQRFGDYKISVGRLPKDDVMDLLSSVKIQYAEGTKELIWEYTGGLVWFVKLLANAAIRRAKAANREWVYPADVFFSLNDVVTEQNCKQFYEGCHHGTLERQMIDAMQSLACRKGMYLSLDTICELLDKDHQEIEQALKRLTLLEIVERNPVKPDMVRFRLDIYRRYFRIAPSSFRVKPEEVVLFEPTTDNAAMTVVETFDDMYGDDEEI